MQHADIVKLVRSMEIGLLTKDTFDSFVQNAQGVFTRDTQFQQFLSTGDNPTSRMSYDFSKGKPEYGLSAVLTFNRMEVKERPDEDKKWLNIHFNDDVEVLGVRSRGEPLRFGHIPGRAFYIAQHQGNGTLEHPFETVYLKLA